MTKLSQFKKGLSGLGVCQCIQAPEAQIAPLLTKKVTVPAEHSDFTDVFLEESNAVLPERTDINEYAIELLETDRSIHPPGLLAFLFGSQMAVPICVLIIEDPIISRPNIANRYLERSPSIVWVVLRSSTKRFKKTSDYLEWLVLSIGG